MLHIVLYEPENAPNTGNVIRLAANTGAALHLIEPLGFEPDAAKLRRAGLDYHDLARLTRHANWPVCAAALKAQQVTRTFAVSTRGTVRYDQAGFQDGDAFVFGPESRGLPASFLESFPPHWRIRLPMVPNNRSLNLSNAVAVVVYEAWRQVGFPNQT